MDRHQATSWILHEMDDLLIPLAHYRLTVTRIYLICSRKRILGGTIDFGYMVVFHWFNVGGSTLNERTESRFGA